jgi:hypothetical protein
MKFIFLLLQKLALFFLSGVYNYIDKNSDGKLSKKEIQDFTKKVKKILK